MVNETCKTPIRKNCPSFYRPLKVKRTKKYTEDGFHRSNQKSPTIGKPRSEEQPSRPSSRRSTMRNEKERSSLRLRYAERTGRRELHETENVKSTTTRVTS